MPLAAQETTRRRPPQREPLREPTLDELFELLELFELQAVAGLLPTVVETPEDVVDGRQIPPVRAVRQRLEDQAVLAWN